MKRIANNIIIGAVGTLFGSGVMYMPWEISTWISAGCLLVTILACNYEKKDQEK